MTSSALSPAAFGVAGATAFAFTPVAIAVAHRTGFLDRPRGYKGHRRPTPYLGGTAVILAIAVATTVLGGLSARIATLLGCAAVLWLVGTVDDRRPIPPLWRVVAEVGVGVFWLDGWGWSVLGSGPADLLLTVFWVVGLVNAFNLMDNIDGATSTVAAISTAGIAICGTAGRRRPRARLLCRVGRLRRVPAPEPGRPRSDLPR